MKKQGYQPISQEELAKLTPRKAVWHHRQFEFGNGWQPWVLEEVEVIAETKMCYKIQHKFSWVRLTCWIFKDSNADRIEFVEKP